jgi:hypothetical protein
MTDQNKAEAVSSDCGCKAAGGCRCNPCTCKNCNC